MIDLICSALDPALAMLPHFDEKKVSLSTSRVSSGRDKTRQDSVPASRQAMCEVKDMPLQHLISAQQGPSLFSHPFLRAVIQHCSPEPSGISSPPVTLFVSVPSCHCQCQPPPSERADRIRSDHRSSCWIQCVHSLISECGSRSKETTLFHRVRPVDTVPAISRGRTRQARTDQTC